MCWKWFDTMSWWWWLHWHFNCKERRYKVRCRLQNKYVIEKRERKRRKKESRYHIEGSVSAGATGNRWGKHLLDEAEDGSDPCSRAQGRT